MVGVALPRHGQRSHSHRFLFPAGRQPAQRPQQYLAGGLSPRLESLDVDTTLRAFSFWTRLRDAAHWHLADDSRGARRAGAGGRDRLCRSLFRQRIDAGDDSQPGRAHPRRGRADQTFLRRGTGENAGQEDLRPDGLARSHEFPARPSGKPEARRLDAPRDHSLFRYSQLHDPEREHRKRRTRPPAQPLLRPHGHVHSRLSGHPPWIHRRRHHGSLGRCRHRQFGRGDGRPQRRPLPP